MPIAAARLKDSRLRTESDEKLMALVAEGSREAFGTLVFRHAEKFRALAIRTLGDAAIADDIVQECYVKLWVHANKFDGQKSSFTTWFYRVVLNRCLDEKRKKRPVPLPDGFDEVDDKDLADDVIVRHQEETRLRAAVSRLNERQRTAISLRYFEELSNAEAAGVMGMKIKAFESLLVRARAKLKESIRA